jgi:hypothetical protein
MNISMANCSQPSQDASFPEKVQEHSKLDKDVVCETSCLTKVEGQCDEKLGARLDLDQEQTADKAMPSWKEAASMLLESHRELYQTTDFNTPETQGHDQGRH